MISRPAARASHARQPGVLVARHEDDEGDAGQHGEGPRVGEGEQQGEEEHDERRGGVLERAGGGTGACSAAWA